MTTINPIHPNTAANSLAALALPEMIAIHAEFLGVGEQGSVHAVVVMPGKGMRGAISTGYFDDIDALRSAVDSHTSGGHVYVTLNPVKPALITRALNRIVPAKNRKTLAKEYAAAPEALTAALGTNPVGVEDKDIVEQRALLIDIDPSRLTGFADYCSTESEHSAALGLRDELDRWIEEQTGARATLIDSGNGGGLIYRLLAPADGAHIKSTLKRLATQFDTSNVHVDTLVHNAARLTRLAGTINTKPSAPGRPQRPCRLERVATGRLDLARLEVALGISPETPKRARSTDKEKAVGRLTTYELAGLVEAWDWAAGANKRHCLALALAGAARKAAWPEQMVVGLVRHLATSAGDDEVQDRVRAVNDTYTKPLDEVAGWSGLSELGLEERDFPSLSAARASRSSYEATVSGLVWNKPSRDGLVSVPLTNFAARILTDIEEDDGADARRVYEVAATLKGRPRRFMIAASSFEGMRWPAERLGAGAVVYPGFGASDHARAAIQLLSGEIAQRTVYSHLGWREINEEYVYLHGGGAIGTAGAVPGVDVRVEGALCGYTLPEVPTGQALRDAIEASLKILDVAPYRLTVPLLASAFRAVLCPSDFSVYLVGPTGAFKSELASLVQRHFGAGMDARHLPGAWSGTANALEALTFAAKDAITVVDDFAPSGSPGDVQRLHSSADRLLRAQGNHSGRLRMRADITLRTARPPRGLILSTGEDVPHGQSLRARMLILDVGPGCVRVDRLTQRQHDAAAGLYAQALAGFVQDLAGRYGSVRLELPRQIAELRDKAARSAEHRRTPDIVANLAVGFQFFLDWARRTGAIGDEDYGVLERLSWKVLGETALSQGRYLTSSEPAARFVDLLRSALATGLAHIAGADGGRPSAHLGACGWRTPGATGGHSESAVAQGPRVGWLEGDHVYLDSNAAHAAVQRLAGEVGEPLGIAAATLRKRLHERGWLASVETKRETLTVRRTLDGSRREVLHLEAARLFSSGSGYDDAGGSDEAVATPLARTVPMDAVSAAGRVGRDLNGSPPLG